MSDRRQNEPLEPELQREDARGPDGAEQQFETRQGPDAVPPPSDDTRARNEEWDETHEVGPRGEVRHGDVPHDPEPEPEGVERFNRTREPVNETPDQPIAYDPPDQRVREPGKGPSENISFDENENVPHREDQRGAAVPALATGMFFPVVLFGIVAIVVILWLVL